MSGDRQGVKKAVHKTWPARKTTAQVLHIGEDMGGGIDAFMREVPGLDSSHLEATRGRSAGILMV
jgi:hypothetical protein